MRARLVVLGCCSASPASRSLPEHVPAWIALLLTLDIPLLVTIRACRKYTRRLRGLEPLRHLFMEGVVAGVGDVLSNASPMNGHISPRARSVSGFASHRAIAHPLLQNRLVGRRGDKLVACQDERLNPVDSTHPLELD